MKRRVRWAVACCLTALFDSGIARAASTEKCVYSRVIANTSGYRNARVAIDHAADFGMPMLLDRRVMPYMVQVERGRELSFTAVGDTKWVTDVAHLPVLEIDIPENCPDEYRYTLRDFDMGMATMGFGLQYKWIGAFASFSLYNGGTMGNATRRAFVNVAFPYFVGLFYDIYGQYKRYDQRTPKQSLVADYTLGLAAQGGPVAFRVGYARFSGLIANVAVPDAHVSATGVLGDEFSAITYVRAGADMVPSPAGYTNAYVRRMGWRLPPRYDVTTAEPIEDKPHRLGFLTLHAEQKDIVEFFDAAVAAAVAPTGALHEARATVHTYDFNTADPRVRDARSGRREGNAVPRLALTGGVAGLPNRPYYGEKAVILPSFRVDAGVQTGEGDGGRFAVDLTLRYSDPETLALFPMAHYPWETGFVVTGEL
ncbi:MAG: hypothetical protein IPI67_17695 [Myxococcales bacterium]|nr:hypothetical protein [Myxococcales bacterium]